MLNTESKPVTIEYKNHKISYICPKCKKVLEFRKKYQGKSLCLKCGQRLDWDSLNNIFVEIVTIKGSEEAATIADMYFGILGIPASERFDTDIWRRSFRDKYAQFYLLFPDRKTHGRFMRLRAKNTA